MRLATGGSAVPAGPTDLRSGKRSLGHHNRVAEQVKGDGSHSANQEFVILAESFTASHCPRAARPCTPPASAPASSAVSASGAPAGGLGGGPRPRTQKRGRGGVGPPPPV